MNERICTVVGVGPGMGMAIAQRFAQEGFHVALISRRLETLETAVNELSRIGYMASGFQGDAANPASIETAFNQIEQELGATSVLVYNASAAIPGVPSTMTEDMLLEQLRVNVVGALTCARQVIPAMRSMGSGTILFTGGGLALQPRAEYSGLAAGKAALRNLTFSLAEELAPDGIHVATVTIAGFVQPDSFFDPAHIAEVYWNLYRQAPDEWQTEVIYKR